jgi:hypothetical protein
MKIAAMAETMPTYYDVLKVERGATADSVRFAYRRLAQKYHPDKMPGNPNAARAMAAINAAYDVLSDPQRRAEHDLWIRRAERMARPLPAAPAVPAHLWAYLHPSISWPWYLLFGTLVVAIGTVATAMYLTAMPARAATAAPAVLPPCQQVAEASACPVPRS